MYKAAYPNLESAIAIRGITKRSIAKVANVSQRQFYEKIKGNASFNWEEVCAIQEHFFPDMTKEYLFTRTPNP